LRIMGVEHESERFYSFGPYRLDSGKRLLFRNGQLLSLTPKVLDLLIVLVQQHGEVVGKDELMRAVWGETAVEESNVTHNLAVLRKALIDGSQAEYIQTVPKRGYRFVGVVQTSAAVEVSRGWKVRAAPTWITAAFLLLVLALIIVGVIGRQFRLPGPAAGTFRKMTNASGEELYPCISPDGRFLSFSARSSGNWDIYLKRIDGNQMINLTSDSPADDTQPVFSPDGRKIAFRSEREGGGIFVVDVTGGPAVRVTDFGFEPSWSPDGRRLAVATAYVRAPDMRDGNLHSQIFTVDLGSGGRRAVTSMNEDAVQPRWSPHGHRIAYWGLRPSGVRDIWTVSVNDGGVAAVPAPVTADAYLDWNPAWSPDGTYLYFSSDRSGVMNLWRVRVEERSGKVLSTPEPVTMPSSYSGHINMSANGKSLVYLSESTQMNLYKVSFDPARLETVGSPTPITIGSRQVMEPNLSRDGRWLVFRTRGEQEDIWVMGTDGKSMRQLTNDKDYDRSPRWSPDGQQIAFYSNRGGRWDIWAVPASGGPLRRLTHSQTGKALNPIWSPDGLRILFNEMGTSPSIMSLSGGQMSPPVPLPTADTRAFFLATSWSPDGRSLAGALSNPQGGTAGVAVYDIGSRTYRRVAAGASPVWLKNQRSMLLFSRRYELAALDMTTGKPHRLLPELGKIHPPVTLSADNRMLFFTVMLNQAEIWTAELR
jgi:Tol biopolymer transport system component/DNA-binding winged helix-turn-helix (wHTH) protein